MNCIFLSQKIAMLKKKLKELRREKAASEANQITEVEITPQIVNEVCSSFPILF
jgi:hypothetical protein